MNTAPDRVTTEVFELAVPPQPESVSVCRLFVGSVARHYSIDEDAVGDLKVATSEAVTNAIKAHNEAGRRELPVRIRITGSAESCRVEVMDQGGGFEPTPWTDGMLTPPTGLYEGSLGLMLIGALFPEAEILSDETTGTIVRFAAKR